MDLCFLAMTDGVKDPTGGTPTFVSPDLIRTDLNWSTVNKTVIVKTARPVTGFRTVQDIKDAIDRSTSGSAVVMQGGVYALRMSNGKHAILNVTSLAGSNGNAVVNFRIMR
jgi:hypothetical protein